MSLSTTSTSVPNTPSGPLDLDQLERLAVTSPVVAWCLIGGLPTLGITAVLCSGLPLFAALMAGSFLLAVALVARRALVTFTGQALRLLVTARLVIVLVLAALLGCSSGNAWVTVVSAVVLWLVADRLLGRWALHDLGRAVKGGRS